MATSGSWNITWASGTWAGRAKNYNWGGNWSKSGDTITLSGMWIYMSMINSSHTGTGSGTDSITVTGGGAQTVTFTWYGGNTSNTQYLNNTSFSVSSTSTSATIQCVIAGENTGSTTIYFDQTVVAPATPSVTIAEVYDTGAKFNVSVSSYGVPASASGRWIEAGIAGQNAWQSPSLRSAIAQNVSSAAITVNNNSTKTTTLTIKPNTQYYYGGHCTNTQLSKSVIAGQLVTKASAPIITPGVITTDSASFFYETTADGGYYNKTIEYSIDNGTTWTTVATITGGSASSGTFTISNLTSGTRYNLQTRTTTTAGSTNANPISFIAKTGLVNAFYGSDGSQSVKTIDLYGSVNGHAERISKVYGEENGETKLFYQGFGHIARS